MFSLNKNKFKSAAQESGYALVIVIVFIVILTITTYGLFVMTDYNIRAVREDVESTRAYYASVAGLRYAQMVIASGNAGELPYTVTGNELAGGDFFDNIGTNEGRPLDMVITISNDPEGSGDLLITVDCNY